MSKFSVGDRVRVLRDDADFAEVRSGDVGTVVGDSDDFDVVVMMDDPRHTGETWTTSDGVEYHWHFYDSSLELVESSVSTGPHLAFNLLNKLEPLKVLAEASRENNVMISLTVTPWDSDEDE